MKIIGSSGIRKFIYHTGSYLRLSGGWQFQGSEISYE